MTSRVARAFALVGVLTLLAPTGAQPPAADLEGARDPAASSTQTVRGLLVIRWDPTGRTLKKAQFLLEEGSGNSFVVEFDEFTQQSDVNPWDLGGQRVEVEGVDSGRSERIALGVGEARVLVVRMIRSLEPAVDDEASPHSSDDAYWANLARDYPPFRPTPVTPEQKALQAESDDGDWGPVISWPHIPVSGANLPDGRILTFASNERDDFPAGPDFTYAAVWDPATNQFTEINHTGHDMFCGHLVVREDGTVFVNGGRNHPDKTTVFDYTSDDWTIIDSMNAGRWYNTSVALPTNQVFTMIGSWGGPYPELWTPGLGWQILSGIDFTAPILDYDGHYEQNWWPLIHVAPDGTIFHSGPTPVMHDIDPTGLGALTAVGPQITGWYPKHGATVMYDEGKLLVAGGAISGSNQGSSDRVMKIDINGASPVVTNLARMAYARKFHNAIMLPDGEVLVIGGNRSGTKFSDTGSVFVAEIWNPQTQAWREVASMSRPRNYHSIALLLQDGRVLSGGGGLCGCSSDHQDGQVYSPPYLFDGNDDLAPRPSISSAPVLIGHGDVFPVSATPGLERFTVTKLGANTHAVNTDQRFLELPFTEVASGQYNLTAHANLNVFTPGYYFLWAINSQGVPSEAAVIQVLTNRPATVQHPGDQSSSRGEIVALQIAAFDPEGDTLSYNASGLPAGLTIDPVNGLIGGTISAVADTSVTVTVDDGSSPGQVSFAWSVIPGSGRILREWWTGIGGTALSALLADADYPSAPTGRDILTRLDAPRDWGDNYGQRIRGYVHPPSTGQYRFWIAGNDESRLLLSTDDDPLNVAEIANVPVSSGVGYQSWNDVPQQQSAPITLAAGRRYYIEALSKEGSGTDHLSVAWQIPGGAVEVIGGAFLSPVSDGFILRQVWTGIAGTGLTSMTGDPDYPNNPDVTAVHEIFEAPVDWAEAYGTRMTALIEAPVSGNYTFWIASDDQGSLRLSSDHNPAHLRQIASVPGWSASRQWDKFPEQRSAPIPLVAGQKYYVEALQKEGGGGDNLAVAWQYPGQGRVVIGSQHLALYTPPLDNRPTVNSPGDQFNHTFETVSLQIDAADPNNDPLAYVASGLPPGLTLNAGSGLIAGTTTAAGNFDVTVTVDDGVDGTGQVGFVWLVNPTIVIDSFVSTPAQKDTAVSLTAVAVGGTNLRYRWNFGDGTTETAPSLSPSVTHSFDRAQRFAVTVTVTNDEGGTAMKSFIQPIHEPLTLNRPAVSMSIVYDENHDRVWNVNPDNGTVSVFDALTHAKLAETAVGQAPRALALAPDGRIWVTNKESATLSVLDADSFEVVETLQLGRGSMPYGIAFDPGGAAGYVTLEGGGRLIRFDPLTGAEIASLAVGASPRHLSISSDGTTVYVSRFVSPPLPGESTATPITEVGDVRYGGEVLEIDAATLSVNRTIVLRHSEQQDAEHHARGIPNYLGPPVISPDGLSAWVPSKQDNIKRGGLRDGNLLTHDGTVRSVSSRIDLTTGEEDYGDRVDHDDGGTASTALFGRYGVYLFVALEASREIALIDAYGSDEIGRWDAGLAPQGLAISPDGLALYVHNFMERSIHVQDISEIMQEGGSAARWVASLDTVSNEVLTPQLLLGKQLFYDARDERLSSQRYMSCASCHNDGGQDGRVWDLTDKGEGLRNTISLRGHAGVMQGPLHWSANFDEVQDFEGQIRELSGGSGLMDDVDFDAGTVSHPLGDPKTGLSADLDALAAYVGSLATFDRSPHRNPDDTLTAAALAGEAVFRDQACERCHAGVTFTDSGVGGLHDVGTIKPASGNRLGAALPGLDTPTLRGVWDSAPYLHDGSAPTLIDAVNAHSGVVLSAEEQIQLAEYLRQVDGLMPSAPQCADADVDGICNLTDTDDDNDGVADAQDCAALVRGVTAVAGPVGPTLVATQTPAGVVLSWRRGDQGHTTNVYRGTLTAGQPFSYDETCLEAENPGAQSLAPDADTPDSNTGHYYLVGANNLCGASRIGLASDGTERLATAACAALGADSDADGVADVADNCPLVADGTQADADQDFVGDVCDVCPGTSDPDQVDADGDSLGDACDTCTDVDGDGFGDPGHPANTCDTDNCPGVPNADQTDTNGNGLGDACDVCPDDLDGDGFCGGGDNCPTFTNPGQEDADSDGIGDACDACVNNADPGCSGCPDPVLTDPDGDGVCARAATLLAAGISMRYLANAYDPGLGTSWTQAAFDDSLWPVGTYGVGYDRSGGALNLLSTVVPESYSVYTRVRVEVGAAAGIAELLVGADYDDAFAVWLNGVEIYRSRELPAGPPDWNAGAALHESSNGTVPDYGVPVDVYAAAGPAFVEGTNVFAIGVWNSPGPTSSDLVLVPWVSVTESDNCPLTANPDQADSDGDGTGDACE